MVLDGVVHPLDVPSKVSITKCVRSDLLMSHKKLSVTPLESTTAIIVALKDTYLDQESDLNPATLHSFDESSVVLKNNGESTFWKQLRRPSGN